MLHVKRPASRFPALHALLLAPLLVVGAALAPASAAEEETSTGVLRICAAADELPYSHLDKSGFENKIAVAVADALGRKPQFVFFSRPSIYIVRDQL
ncbi:MAG: methanol oxidation system protein MoxJ, partial [Hyphomicrobium sp.]|nr:methanol oxidation system protein MoxJ [Hyphomicrobium sp.]